MKTLDIPFNKFLDIKLAKDDFILMIEEKPEYLNHLGTIHASVIFALAEASSGEYLLNEFKDYKKDVIPVLRKAEIKYSSPANGELYTKVELYRRMVEETIEELNIKRRAIIPVMVEVYNNKNDKVMTAIFDWFVTLNQPK